MPMMWPPPSTSGPPESPGWMSAATRMSPLSCWVSPPLSSLAVIVSLSPVTLPGATAGVPPRPPALPSATTGSPTCTVDESPTCAVCSPDALLSWMIAMSWLRSYPTTAAVYVCLLPTSVTLILVAPLMTWLLVRISPSDVSTMPVPAAAACCRPNVVLMSTIVGSTAVAIPAASALDPVDGAVCPGVVGAAAGGAMPRDIVDVSSVPELSRHAPNATAAPAHRKAITTARTITIPAPPDRRGGGGGGGPCQ